MRHMSIHDWVLCLQPTMSVMGFGFGFKFLALKGWSINVYIRHFEQIKGK